MLVGNKTDLADKRWVVSLSIFLSHAFIIKLLNKAVSLTSVWIEADSFIKEILWKTKGSLILTSDLWECRMTDNLRTNPICVKDES